MSRQARPSHAAAAQHSQERHGRRAKRFLLGRLSAAAPSFAVAHVPRPPPPPLAQSSHPHGVGRPRQRTHRARAQRSRGLRRRRLSHLNPAQFGRGGSETPPKQRAAARGDGPANRVAGRPARATRRSTSGSSPPPTLGRLVSRVHVWWGRSEQLPDHAATGVRGGGVGGGAVGQETSQACAHPPTLAGCAWAGESRGGFKKGDSGQRNQQPAAFLELKRPCFEPSWQTVCPVGD